MNTSKLYLEDNLIFTGGNTYFIDIDGTIVPNLSNKEIDEILEKDPDYIEELLPGVKHFFATLPEKDIVIFTTARLERHREFTEKTLRFHNIKYRLLITSLNSGPRYLINDTPNVFYKKAIGINVLRDTGFGDTFIFDPEH